VPVETEDQAVDKAFIAASTARVQKHLNDVSGSHGFQIELLHHMNIQVTNTRTW
jgi:hypothetical protein